MTDFTDSLRALATWLDTHDVPQPTYGFTADVHLFFTPEHLGTIFTPVTPEEARARFEAFCELAGAEREMHYDRFHTTAKLRFGPVTIHAHRPAEVEHERRERLVESVV